MVAIGRQGYNRHTTKGLINYLASIEQHRVFCAISQPRRCGRHVKIQTITCCTTTRATTTAAAGGGGGGGARASSSRAVNDQTIGALGFALHLMLG